MNLERRSEKPLIPFAKPEPVTLRIQKIKERKKILDIEY